MIRLSNKSSVCLYFRYLNEAETLIYVANFGESTQTADIRSNFDVTLPSQMNVKIASLDSNKYKNVPVTLGSLSLNAGEAVILGTN